MIGKILLLLMLADVLICIFSFLDAIPLGKSWMVPRVPVLVALVLLLIQIPQRRRTFYCETCGRYIRPQELLAKCNSCNGKRRPRFLTPLGTLACKCPSHTCLERKTISYGGNARTRFSRLFPYGAGNRSRQSFLCGVCGNEINMGNIINLSWYSGTEQLAMNYCRNFLAQGFGSVNLTGSGVNFAASTSLPSELIFGFRTKNRDVRRAEFRLHFAVKGTERKLWSSEETMLLLDGAAGAGERDAVIDAFLLDLQELNVAHAVWKNPVLVGICADRMEEAQAWIASLGDNPAEMEKKCRMFLMDSGNEDAVQRLEMKIEHLHYFLYRTGTIEKIYNVVPGAQAMFYDAVPALSKVWPLSGALPQVRGKLK